MTQTEAELEQKLIERLTGLGYEPVTLHNAEDFKANLKAQLEKHIHIKLSDTEFKSILNHLDKGKETVRSLQPGQASVVCLGRHMAELVVTFDQ